MTKPIAVLISDIHYNLHTLPVADAALRLAVSKANALDVPLIIAGDMHDTKANLRAECMNAMINTISEAKKQPWVLRGNHDQINEKSQTHALNFLGGLTVIVEKPVMHPLGIAMIPYYNDVNALFDTVKYIHKSTPLVMHQGIHGTNSGEYIQDKSAITKADVAGRRVISGHYHTRQSIALPDSGSWDYIGNPYTLNFGEANDPEKGFQILMDDYSLEFIPTNLRKHVILELEGYKLDLIRSSSLPISPNDIVKIRVVGTKEQLAKINKSKIGEELGIKNFRLELSPVGTITQAQQTSVSQESLLDGMIDSLTNTTIERKTRLKELWKGL
jgi:DNA repair exonuclease SbcCD nuclease subunit